MGLAIAAYLILAVTGSWMKFRPSVLTRPNWLRPLHFFLGFTLAALVLLLLAIGIVGTLGHFGSLGHSSHLPAGLAVVALTLVSAWSAMQISPAKPWARSLHVGLNIVLGIGLAIASITGWIVVQKYLP